MTHHSPHDHNMIAIAPAEVIEQINEINIALGHSEREFAVPLSQDGKLPATHYACSPSVTKGYAVMMMKAPPEPDEKEDDDDTLYVPLPEETVNWLRENVIMSVNPPLDREDENAVTYPSARAHFEAVIDKAGLKEIESDILARMKCD